MAKTRIDDNQYKPAGADTQLQYNAAGSVASSPLLTFDYTNNLLITDNIRAVPGDNFNLGDFDAGSWIHINLAGDISLNNQVGHNWNFATDGSLLFPNLTTTQRDAIIAAEGMQIYNVTTHEYEMYNGTAWVPMGGSSSALVIYSDDVFTYSGTNVFTISSPAIANSDNVSLNGLVLRPTTDYTLSGTTLTILVSLTSGDQIQAKYATSIAGSNITGFVVDEFTNTTGPTPTFTLSTNPITSGEFISLNGVLLRPTTDYTLVGTSLTIITATTNGDFIQAQYAIGTGGGGGGTPGGSNGDIQFKNGSAFAGDDNLNWDGADLHIGNDGNLVLDGPDGANISWTNTNGNGSLGIDSTGRLIMQTTNSTASGGMRITSTGLTTQIDMGATIAAASALLEIQSTTQGFLPSRMTTTQRDAIVSPAVGLQIYNSTTNAIEVWTGLAWQSFGRNIRLNSVPGDGNNIFFNLDDGTPLDIIYGDGTGVGIDVNGGSTEWLFQTDGTLTTPSSAGNIALGGLTFTDGTTLAYNSGTQTIDFFLAGTTYLNMTMQNSMNWARTDAGDFEIDIQAGSSNASVMLGNSAGAPDNAGRLIFQGNVGVDIYGGSANSVRIVNTGMHVNRQGTDTQDPTAALQVDAVHSNTPFNMGFLPPRVTTTERNVPGPTLPEGLTIYNTTTHKLQVWDGSVWQDAW